MRLPVVVGVLLGLGFTAAVSTAAKDSPAKEFKAICPISGEAAKASVSTDYHGGKVYFCCPACIKPFQKDTAKYAAKANCQLVVTGQAEQVACPLTGRPVNPQKTLDVGGVTVGFCCGGCQGKVAAADPAKQLEMIFDKGFDKGFKLKKSASE